MLALQQNMGSNGVRLSSLVFDVGMDVSHLVSCSHDRLIVVIDFGEGLDAHCFV